MYYYQFKQQNFLFLSSVIDMFHKIFQLILKNYYKNTKNILKFLCTSKIFYFKNVYFFISCLFNKQICSLFSLVYYNYLSYIFFIIYLYIFYQI